MEKHQALALAHLVFIVVCKSIVGLWPRGGYWAPTEMGDPSSVAACPPPRERCLGWAIAQGASLCGPGYLHGSYLCTACARGFFLEDTGECSACPMLTTSWQRYSGLLFIGAAVLGIVALVYVCLVVLVCVVGGTLSGGLFRMLHLALWMVMCAQVR